MTLIPPSGARRLPRLGLGTWRMGETPRSRTRELAAVRRALDIGYRLIDTAEMYGNGVAEEIVGQALDEAVRGGSIRREDIVVVSKVSPHNATRSGTVAAFERSRKRLRLDTIDLYLLHWRGAPALRETVDAFEGLRGRGLIAAWGVSNFDTADMVELWSLDGGPSCASNQVYYSLTERGPEFDLLPWQRAHGVSLMAYSPIDQGSLTGNTTLASIAATCSLTPAQLALAWVLSRPGTVAIAKAVRTAHLQENFAAAALGLDVATLARLEGDFPPPRRKAPLAMR